MRTPTYVRGVPMATPRYRYLQRPLDRPAAGATKRRVLLYLAMAALLVVPLGATPAVAEAHRVRRAQCTRHHSTVTPPRSIRVYMVKERRVVRVPFRLYVARVVSSEWNNVHPRVRRAGAVAVKQYAWYHILRWRGGTFRGRCFDVRDTTRDQIYRVKPARQIPDRVWAAVNATWSWRLYRKGNGKFLMSGYRTGNARPCASERKFGYRLYAKSAKRCALNGWSATRILRVYYTARVVR